MFNLLSDPLLTVTGGRAVSLPELFASLAKREVREFPFLRPHQRPSWHMFLVQIGALAVWGAGWKELPDDPARWREALRKLTDAFPDEEPWQLVVEDWARPAFLQPPDPGDLKWSPADTPDELDLLILSKNHDLKRGTLQQASAEHWVYLLISVQTTVGFFGQKKYGIARMNGGFANRPLLGLVPAPGGTQSIDPSQWWIRDVQALIEIRREPPTSFVGTVGGRPCCGAWSGPRKTSWIYKNSIRGLSKSPGGSDWRSPENRFVPSTQARKRPGSTPKPLRGTQGIRGPPFPRRTEPL